MKRWMGPPPRPRLIGLLATGAPLRADELRHRGQGLNEGPADRPQQLQGDAGRAQEQARGQNAFCSASGEYIGTARVFRVVAAECRKGDLAELDKALKGLDDLVDNTCK